MIFSIFFEAAGGDMARSVSCNLKFYFLNSVLGYNHAHLKVLAPNAPFGIVMYLLLLVCY